MPNLTIQTVGLSINRDDYLITIGLSKDDFDKFLQDQWRMIGTSVTFEAPDQPSEQELNRKSYLITELKTCDESSCENLASCTCIWADKRMFYCVDHGQAMVMIGNAMGYPILTLQPLQLATPDQIRDYNEWRNAK